MWEFPQTLEYLNLSCNHIGSINDLKLPRLLYLDLSCNLITDLEPISALKALRSLYLGYNLIKHIIPITKLPNLLEIDLEHNLIESIDNIIPVLESNLIVFIIKNNPITR
jgi:internalin A